MSNISFIYFDIGGVLADWHAGLRKLADTFEIPEKEIFTLFDEHAVAIDNGELTWAEFAMIAKKKFELSFSDLGSAVKVFSGNFNVIQESHDLVRDLQGQYKLGILSNIAADAYEWTYKKGRIPQIAYDVEVVSGRLGFGKPQPEIYEYAAKEAGVPAEQLLFIDDREENIQGAKDAGWQGMVFDPAAPKKSVEKIKELLG